MIPSTHSEGEASLRRVRSLKLSFILIPAAVAGVAIASLAALHRGPFVALSWSASRSAVVTKPATPLNAAQLYPSPTPPPPTTRIVQVIDKPNPVAPVRSMNDAEPSPTAAAVYQGGDDDGGGGGDD